MTLLTRPKSLAILAVRRRQSAVQHRALPKLNAPEWDGQNLPGGTLLLRSDEGYGDAIQFIRYAPLARPRCGRLIVQCPGGLVRLFATVAGIDEAIAPGPVPNISAHASLLSTMHLCGTQLETIPASVPYLAADPARVAAFQGHAGKAEGIKVGLVWAGSPKHKNDRNRSIALTALAPLLAVEGVTFFSLQKGQAAAETATQGLRQRIIDLGSLLEDFADTAAAIRCLDLVISVDTAAAHLAGALAKPVWMLLPFAPDWRWLLGRSDSPWYPSMRLYRQPARGDWSAVIAQVGEDLRQFVAARRGSAATGGREDFQALYSAGGEAAKRGDHDGAITWIRRALAVDPTHAEAHYNLGVALRELGRVDEAVRSFEEAIKLDSEFSLAHYNLGHVLRKQGLTDEAVASYERALALDPDNADVHSAMGEARQGQERPDMAAANFEKALALKPDHSEARNNLGLALVAQGRVEEAVACFEQLLAMNPGTAYAHYNLAWALLLQGDMPRGAAEYEWRWQTDAVASLPELDAPAWDGQRLPDQSLLLRTEQGFGDAIQFIRYAPLVRQRCGRLIVQCPGGLARLFATVAGVDEVIFREEKPPPVVAHAPLLSLMHLLGTTLETIPAEVPYLGVDPTRVARFQEQVAAAPGLKVGLAWAGNAKQPNNRNRSTALAALSPLLAVEGVRFFSLQKGEPATEIAASGLEGRIIDLAPSLKDFADTAAAMSSLDLVISVDTSVAHLAGALAKPVWTLVCFRADWRWLRDREDTPWYPTMRLYRQPAAGDWGAVVQAVARDLSRYAVQHVRSLADQSSSVATAKARFAEALQHHKGGRPGQAEDLFRQALADDPDHCRALYYLGIIAARRGDHQAPRDLFRRAIELAPNYADAHYNLGNVLEEEGRLDEAVASYRQAALLEPNAAQVHVRLGDALRTQGRMEEAAASYRRALALNPGDASVHLSLAEVLLAQDHLEEAVTAYGQILRLNPNRPDVLNNLGLIQRALGRVDLAIASYQRALSLNPDSAATHANLGIALLAKGDLPRGSAEYEWRLHEERFWDPPPVARHGGAVVPVGMLAGKRPVGCPRWDGTPAGNRTILLQAEQGYGDSIQFVRYSQLVRALCSRVVLHCPIPVAPLLATMRGIDEVVTTIEPPANVDFHATLISLMHIFGTTLETIPAEVPYLSVDPIKLARFKERVAGTAGLKVGLVWAGNPANTNDHNRSMPLKTLAPVLAADGVAFFSLQKGEAAAAISIQGFAGRIIDFAPDFDDFADTAAAISCLDLVISVDTAVVHLAGALAKPVWALLPFAPHWPWMLDRDDSPWYPTMRLYRQAAIGDWDRVIQKVAVDLSSRAEQFAVDPARPVLPTHAEPNTAAVHVHLGNALRHHGRMEEAAASYRRALAVNPGDASVHVSLGAVLRAQCLFDDAAAAYRQALALNPKLGDAHNGLGLLLASQQRIGEAISRFEEALRLDPQLAAAHSNLGAALLRESRLEEAAQSFHRALELQPNLVVTLLNLGNVLREQGKFDEAEMYLRRGIELDPKSAEPHNCLGVMLKAENRVDEAIESYERAIALDPNNALAHLNLGLGRLLNGEIPIGAAHYEWRWKAEPCPQLPAIAAPAWDGQALPGKTLLLRTEQGFGDAIQFIRYASLVRARCGRLVVQCPRQLLRLFATVAGVDDVVTAGQELPPLAAHAPLLSLMHLFGTTLETIPAKVPYLSVDQSWVARFGARIAAASGLKVGLVWAGAAIPRNRSLKLKAFTAVLATEEPAFFSLQKGEAAGEIADDGYAGRIVDLGPDLKDFADTAAAIGCLDLVISVDTAVAHLAGALGKPVWTLLPFAPDWRWLLDRDDSPWYPTMRLYRQPAVGEWGAVIDRMATDLSRHVAMHAAAGSQPLLPSSQSTVFAEALDHHRAGRPEQAELLFRQMLADDPGDYRARYYLGIVAARRGNYKAAEDLFRGAIALAPDYADAHFNLGNVLAQLRRFAEATASYREAVLLQPDAAEPHVHLANALYEQGRAEEAIASYRRAIALNPVDAAVHLALGAVLQAQGHKEDAVAAYRQALTLNPELADAHNKLGAILASQDRIDNAIECFQEAIRIDPQLAGAYANLGTALRRQNRLEDAAQGLRRAVELRPDFLGALITLGYVLRDQGKLDESRAYLERAIELDPTSAESHNCLGLAAQEQNRIAEAVASYERAIALRPDHAWAHLNLGIARLLKGDLPGGAAHYEWRWQIDECPSLPSLAAPAWDGQPLRDQSLLLRAEQGFGDAIQFIRYAPLIRQRCRHLVVQCPTPLVPLLATAPEVDEVISDQEKPPPIAAHAPLLSLMHLLGTTLETVPAEVPYLGIDPSRVERFKERLSATAGLRLGLVWAGSPIHKNNHNRSLKLVMLAPLLAMDEVTFYSLQKGEPAVEISADGFANRIVDLGADLRDFADTAAAINCLDLVISVDTAVAHLAGALGKPVWTLIPFAPDWRWLLDSDDSVWYPTMRLYRQPALGDWQSVIGRVAADLSRHAKQHRGAATARPRGSAKADEAFAAALRHHRAGRLERAETIFRRVITTDPGHSRALYYLGIIAGRRGKYKTAEDFFHRALALAPHYADAHYNLGNALQEQDRLEDALGSYRRSVMLEPTAAAAHFNLAETLRMLGRSEEATASYRRAIALNPDAAEPHLNLGNMLQEQKNPAEAIACFQQVLRLLPGNASAHYNIGNALKLQGRFEEAVQSYGRAICSNPNYADAYNNLGNVQHELGRVDEAIVSFRRSLTLQPNAAPTHKNLGMSLLLKGNLPEGSAEYEWRWQEKEFQNMPPVHCPPWDGQLLPDQTILLRAEQGYGDAIQFIRYAPLVRARCGRVVLQCPPQLGELLATTSGIDTVVTKAMPVPSAAVHAHLLSLMHILGTTLETIPAVVPYFRVDPARAAHLQESIGTSVGLKVGLVWAGNPDNKNDKTRSLPLAMFSPLLAIEGASFFSLQKGEAAAEIDAAGLAGRIVDLGSLLANFADAAAAISCLDLVISVDTAAAHLAGALGKSVWTLLPFAPDWRWLLERDDSPWYPTMRLYRQPAASDWGSVIANAAGALARTIRGDGPLSTSPVESRVAARRPTGKPVVMFDWPPSSHTGWGVYGLNLMLNWARRIDLSLCCVQPIDPARLLLNPLERKLIDQILEASRDAGRRLSGLHAEASVSCPLLRALGNNLSSGRDPALFGTPSIGIIFFETIEFDQSARRRARQYPLIVAGSTWNRDILVEFGIDQVQTVLQGVDTTHFHPAPKQGLFADRFVVFSGGKLERRKGQDLVVLAFRLFAQRHPEALLVTGWSSPWPRFARTLAKNPAIEPVSFRPDGQLDVPMWLQANGIPGRQLLDLGPVPNAEMPRILREVDVALFPNRAEGGTNLVAMECMACGVPTILSANTGHLDLIREGNCFVLQHQRPIPGQEYKGWGESDLDEIVERLEAVYCDRREAQNRGRLGAQTLSQLSWARQLDKLAELIRPYLV